MTTDHTLQRRLLLQGVSNFRDLGGYLTADGHHRVRWGRIYRSDHLAHLTDQDRAQLARLGLARVVDFRGEQERLAQSYQWPGLEPHALSIEPTVVQQAQALMASGQPLDAHNTAELMHNTYRGFVRHHRHRFAELFALLLADERPLVFHCTAGKDRTGFAAALILTVLGVSRSDIDADYLLTNRWYQRPSTSHGSLPEAALRVVWGVQPSFLQAADEALCLDWGGWAGFLRDGLGLGEAERQRLRDVYLEAV